MKIDQDNLLDFLASNSKNLACSGAYASLT